MSNYTEVYNRFIRYKYRYEKALNIGITEDSKYYNLFCEIERRYAALFEYNEFNSNLWKHIGTEKSYILGTLNTMLNKLNLRNDTSSLVKVKLFKADTKRVNIYLKAKDALEKLKNIDFKLNKKELDRLIIDYTSDIVLWYLTIRDILYGEEI